MSCMRAHSLSCVGRRFPTLPFVHWFLTCHHASCHIHDSARAYADEYEGVDPSYCSAAGEDLLLPVMSQQIADEDQPLWMKRANEAHEEA